MNAITHGNQPQRLTSATNDTMLIEGWINNQSSERTKGTYRTTVEQFVEFIGRKPLAAVTVEDLNAYRAHLVATYRPHTAKTKLNVVKSLLSFGAMTHYLQFNVGAAVKSPKAHASLHERILTEDEVMAIIDAAGNERDKAIIVTLYATGGRVSEVVGVRWADIKATKKNGAVTVTGKGDEQRTIAIARNVYNALVASRPEWAKDSDPVFISQKGGALSRQQIWRIIKAAAEKAGLPNASPHWFRHAHISHALDNGAKQSVVQASAGHKSADTTAGYSHVKPDDGSGLYLNL